MKTLYSLFLITLFVYPIVIYYNNKLINTPRDTSILYLGVDENTLDSQFNYFKKKLYIDDIFNHTTIKIQQLDFHNTHS